MFSYLMRKAKPSSPFKREPYQLEGSSEHSERAIHTQNIIIAHLSYHSPQHKGKDTEEVENTKVTNHRDGSEQEGDVKNKITQGGQRCPKAPETAG